MGMPIILAVQLLIVDWTMADVDILLWSLRQTFSPFWST